MSPVVRRRCQGSLVVGLVCLLLRSAGAQQSAGAARTVVVTSNYAVATGHYATAAAPQQPAPPTREELENYIQVLKGELERSDARVAGVRTQLLGLDDDIESRVARIVSLLSSVRDSTDTSGARVRKAKEEALKGLEATAKYYAQERDRRQKEMGNRYAQLSDDQLARNVAALNARIEVRVTQSLAIASSLVQPEEGAVQRYENDDTNYNHETDAYKKTRHDAQASVKIKTDVVAELRASIDKLTRDIAASEAELRTTSDPQRKEQLANEIQTMRHTIDLRRDQIEELLRAPKPATRPVSSQAAFEMDKMLDEMVQDLRRDFFKFKGLVAELDAAGARSNTLGKRLEKATAALAAMSVDPAAATPSGGTK
jgi:hypothetical protein